MNQRVEKIIAFRSENDASTIFEFVDEEKKNDKFKMNSNVRRINPKTNKSEQMIATSIYRSHFFAEMKTSNLIKTESSLKAN